MEITIILYHRLCTSVNRGRNILKIIQSAKWQTREGKSLKSLLLSDQPFLRWILKGDFDTEIKMIVSDLLKHGRLPPPPKVPAAQNPPDMI